MTLPDERYRALLWTKALLLDLLSSSRTPRVPKKVRDRAASCLKHFPYEIDLERLAQESPRILQVSSTGDELTKESKHGNEEE